MKKVTIIGGGLGGLTAGALLAKDGYSVTLLEQHTIVGGCATTFKRKGGFVCEVGLHEMDGIYSNPLIAKIFTKLGVYESIEFVKPDAFFEVTTKYGSFLMPDGVEEAKNALVDRFPHEKKGIERYFKLIQMVATSLTKLQNLSWYHYALFPFLFWDILFYKSKSITDVLDTIIQDKELKLILNANVAYYSDTAERLSFLLHAVAQYSYYKGGGWFIKGGSGRLSDYLAKVIKDHGGEVITKANVTACRSNVVTYSYKKVLKNIQSDIIISNLSPEQTYQLYNEPYQEKREISESLLTIYIGFKKNLKEVYGEKAYSQFMIDHVGSIEEYNQTIKESMLKRGFIFVDYSQIDSGLAPEGKSFGAVCMSDYLDEWESLDEENYRKTKQNLIKTVLIRLEEHYPNITDLVEFTEVGTAKTVKRYIKTPKGSAYGFRPTPKQFFRIPKVKSSKIDNLYFVGQWVIAGGFSPTISSGYLCYEKIDKG